MTKIPTREQAQDPRTASGGPDDREAGPSPGAGTGRDEDGRQGPRAEGLEASSAVPTQGSAAAARRTHTPEVAGSSPAPAKPWLDKHGKLQPGVYQGVDFDTYAAWPACNYSILRHIAKTPAHAHWEQTHQQESTKFQGLGHLLHQAILEPKLFMTTGPVVAPKVDRRTTLGKAQWADFERKNAGRQIILPEQMDTLRGVTGSIARHATAREVLYGFGTNELSIIWYDPATKVLCKGRIDRFTEYQRNPLVLDLKSTSKPATTHNAERSVMEYGYHEQAAFYLRGLETLVPADPGVVRQFWWLIVETEPPWAVRIFQADDAALDIARDEIDKYLAAYAVCLKTGEWPAWPEGVDLLGLPAWAYKRFNLE